MAPEVLLNGTDVIEWDASRDIYSLGVVFYYLVHKKVPFTGLTRYLHKRAVERKQYVLREGIRQDYMAIIQNCMKWNPNDRPSLDDIDRQLYEAFSNKNSVMLPAKKLANLDDNSIQDTAVYHVDPLILVTSISSILILLVIIITVVGLTRKKEIAAPSTGTELVKKDNNL